MKNLLLLLVFACLANLADSQTTTKQYDLNYLKTRVAEKQEVPVASITFIEVRTYDSQSFAYARLTKDSKPVTFVHALSNTAGPDFPFIGGSITCTGVGCAECDIEGLPKIEDIYCTCQRRALENGHCNMTKSIGVKP